MLGIFFIRKDSINFLWFTLPIWYRVEKLSIEIAWSVLFLCLKPQLHWESLLAARWRVYNLLVNSPSVIMPASKLAASKKATSKVEHVQHLLATRWLVGVFVKCNRSF